MSHKSAPPTVSTIGIDLGKNSFHLVGLDQRGAIVWQLKCSRAQLERRLANIPCCLIGMEACKRLGAKMAFEVFPLVSLGCARIPMMARSKLLHFRGLIH